MKRKLRDLAWLLALATSEEFGSEEEQSAAWEKLNELAWKYDLDIDDYEYWCEQADAIAVEIKKEMKSR